MHRNVSIEIVMVQAAADNEHSNPITTVKPDVIVILRADQGIVMENGSKQSTRMYSWIMIEYLHADVAFMQESVSHIKQNLCRRNSWKHKPLILQQQKELLYDRGMIWHVEECFKWVR